MSWQSQMNGPAPQHWALRKDITVALWCYPTPFEW